jgi:hypothetical protein
VTAKPIIFPSSLSDTIMQARDGDKGEEYGVIFLHSVFVGGEMKKLKKP